MTSVVIAAHNEAAVLGRCLDALLPPGAEPPPDLDVTVVANGCVDGTAAVAAARRVRVITLDQPGKAGALNAGDAVARGFPRVYLDADVVLPQGALTALAEAVRAGTPLAAVPRRSLDLSGRPAAVRAYYAINSRLPAYRDGLFGRGVIVLSAAGRARFDRFPDEIADDLFLDSLFTPAEKREVRGVESRVATPRRTGELVRRLARVRAGNAAMRRYRPATRAAARTSWLRDVVLPRPWLAPAAVCYVAITVAAAALARRTGRRWVRADSTRNAGATS